MATHGLAEGGYMTEKPQCLQSGVCCDPALQSKVLFYDAVVLFEPLFKMSKHSSIQVCIYQSLVRMKEDGTWNEIARCANSQRGLAWWVDKELGDGAKRRAISSSLEKRMQMLSSLLFSISISSLLSPLSSALLFD